MSNNEMQELSDKLRRGLQLAEKRLLEKNARNGKLLSQGTPDGKVIYCLLYTSDAADEL